MENLSLVLKQRRKELGLTLAQIAEKMGVSEATVQRWESGNIKSVRYDRLDKLAEILKVDPVVFMGWDTPVGSSDGAAEFRDRLEEGLRLRDMSPAELSRRTGIGEGAISQYRKGAYKATQRNLEKIAEVLAVPIAWLMGSDIDVFSDRYPNNVLPMPKMGQVPLIGAIACGEPITAEENIEQLVDLPEHIRADFALRCKGDSMINLRIFDGDIVYIRQQPDVADGEIAAVLIGDEATLKRVRRYPDHISLEPANPMYEPLVFWRQEMDNIRILGKAVAFTSAVR